MKALFPRPRGPALDAVLLNTGGGITGGDRFDVAATAGADTRLTITTQAAERAYKAQPEEIGRPLLLCQACRSQHYCSVECQKTYWKAGHKRESAALP